MPARAFGGGQVALAASATWRARAAPRWRSAPRPRPPARPPIAGAAGGPAERAPIVLALTATHPTSAALGSLSAHLSSIGLLSPAWLSLEPRRALRLQRRGPVHGRAHAARRAARAGARRSRAPRRRPARRRRAAAAAGRAPRRRAARARRARHRARLARPAAVGARALPDVRAASCALELGRAPQIVVTVPPVRTMRALRTRLLRPARARAAGAAARAGLERARAAQRARPGRVARVLEADAAHGAARRAALARPDGRADLGLALERDRRRGRRAGDAGAALPAGHGASRCSAPTARAWASTRGSSRTARCSSSCSSRARRSIAGVALWVRGGESSATWRQPLCCAALAVAGRALERRQRVGAARCARSSSRLRRRRSSDHDGAADEPARDDAACAAQPRAPAAHDDPAVGHDRGDERRTRTAA